MSSESVCHVTRSWVDLGSFHTRLLVWFMIFYSVSPEYFGLISVYVILFHIHKCSVFLYEFECYIPFSSFLSLNILEFLYSQFLRDSLSELWKRRPADMIMPYK
jgi:hypothetical protein